MPECSREVGRDVFEQACSQFVFSLQNQKDLLFFTDKTLFSWDYSGERKSQVKYEFENDFTEQPIFGQFSKCQTKFILVSTYDAIFVDMHAKDKSTQEVNLDKREDIS